MSSERRVDDGGPAFPRAGSLDGNGALTNYDFPTPGMSLRDYFAAHVLQAIVIVTSFEKHNPGKECGLPVREAMVSDAYDLADAMLAERAKRTGAS